MTKKAVKRKKMSALKRTLIILASIVFTLVAIFSFMMICDAIAHAHARVVPGYAKDRQGLEAVLARDMDGWTEQDYDFVYRQTGLTKAYFDGAGALSRKFVLACQDDLFFDAQPEHDSELFGSYHDYFPGHYFNMVPLQAGDVIISSSVHTMGWKNGHAALVLDPSTTLQAICVGTLSQEQGTVWFRQATNFMVLRPNIDAGQAEDIAAWARRNLFGVPYSLFTGIFNAKDQSDGVQTTQCAHLVWQAYKAFGYEIDSSGGAVVSPRNIANCSLFTVIQVNGFDLDKLWS